MNISGAIMGICLIIAMVGSGALLHPSFAKESEIVSTEASVAQTKNDVINNSSRWHTVETWSLGVSALTIFSFIDFLRSLDDYSEKTEDLKDDLCTVESVHNAKERASKRIRKIRRLLNKICRVLVHDRSIYKHGL